MVILCLFGFIFQGAWGQVTIQGAGAQGPAPIFSEWSYAFSLLKPDVKIAYAPSNGIVGMELLTTQCRTNYQVDFGGLEGTIPIIEGLSSKIIPDPDLQYVPILASPIVFVYNLPTIATTAVLQLTWKAISKIFQNASILWNDPEIAQANPLLSLPAVAIHVVLRQDVSSTTVVVTQGIAKTDSQWDATYGKNVSWTIFPPGLMNLTNRVTAQGTFAEAAAVVTIPYSIGYLPLAYANEASLPYASVENHFEGDPGDIVAPTVEAVEIGLAALGVTDATALPAWVVFPGGNGSYPLIVVAYLAYHTGVDTDCGTRSEMFKFFNWALSSDDAIGRANAMGYTSMSENMTNQVLQILSKVTCSGTSLLQVTYQDGTNSTFRQVIISLAAILLAITALLAAIFVYKRKSQIAKAAGLAFGLAFLLGGAINCIGVFVWALIPTSDAICQAQMALLWMGYIFILGAMFSKCWEVSKILTRVETGDISPIEIEAWWKFCLVFFRIIFVGVTIVSVWLGTTPPESITVITDPVDLIGYHSCANNPYTAFYCFFYLILLGWGGYLAYITRDIWVKYHYPNESKAILTSIYNLAFCGSILLPLALIANLSQEILFFLVSVFLMFPTGFALTQVYGPKMIQFLASSKRDKSRGGTASIHTGKRHSQLKTTAEKRDREDERAEISPIPNLETDGSLELPEAKRTESSLPSPDRPSDIEWQLSPTSFPNATPTLPTFDPELENVERGENFVP